MHRNTDIFCLLFKNSTHFRIPASRLGKCARIAFLFLIWTHWVHLLLLLLKQVRKFKGENNYMSDMMKVLISKIIANSQFKRKMCQFSKSPQTSFPINIFPFSRVSMTSVLTSNSISLNIEAFFPLLWIFYE